jgi:hypothetical protein
VLKKVKGTATKPDLHYAFSSKEALKKEFSAPEEIIGLNILSDTVFSEKSILALD